MRTLYERRILESFSRLEFSSPAWVVTSEKWISLAARLDLQPEGVIEIQGITQIDPDKTASRIAGAGTVIAVGDGDVIDAARYAAWKSGSHLALVPTVISGERLVRPEVAVRDSGLVKVVGQKPADLLAVDAELIWAGDEEKSRAGVGDVLAISTALEDWKRAAKDEGYDEGIAEEALDLLAETMDRADEIFDLTEAGIKALVNGLAGREEIAARAGSRRPVSGSEHVFADCAEMVAGRPLARGELVCLGVILMAELQDRPSKPAKQFLHWIRVPWKPEQIGLSEGEVGKILLALPAFSREHGREKTSIDLTDMTHDRVKKIIAGMREPFLHTSLMDRED